MKLRKLLISLIIIWGMVLASTAVNATLWVETGDVGQLVGDEQVLPAGTTRISGYLYDNAHADMFGFGWAGGGITIDIPVADFDTQLFLFDSLGFGLVHDDDSGPGRLSAIVLDNLDAGSYLIAVSGWNFDPVSGDGLIFPTGDPGPFGPTGPGGAEALSGWDLLSGTATGGYYTIDFSGATSAPVHAPEPATILLLGAGLLGVVGFRRKKKA